MISIWAHNSRPGNHSDRVVLSLKEAVLDLDSQLLLTNRWRKWPGLFPFLAAVPVVTQPGPECPNFCNSYLDHHPSRLAETRCTVYCPVFEDSL